ncbi:hypothetical protein [Longimicrobium terrae]|uniref:Uncharacterized protein n=1 Tax=Longimicrobium terrae TaxID=1639882 RepID=A0A841H889_9BACT|nr:hypothetical protein [Longimicrobium terrae]MBB4639669.1 hypothetical protein [Longimicrobium terrae]MBB6074046.1 hypothetical protein [Longimicrobium terrae]
MKTLNISDLDVATFEISDKVTREAVWPCTGCLSGCGINPPA